MSNHYQMANRSDDYTRQEASQRLSAGSRIVMIGIVTLLVSLIGYFSLVRYDALTSVIGMGINLALFLTIVGMRFRGLVSHRRAIGMVVVLCAMWLIILGMFTFAMM